MGFSTNTQEREEMTAAAATIMREYAATRWPTLNHKGRMSRLADKLNWTHRRVRSIYQQDDRARLRADEMAALDELSQQEARDEFQTLEARIAAMEALLFGPHADFYRPQVDAFREHAFGPGQRASGRRGENGRGDRETDEQKG